MLSIQLYVAAKINSSIDPSLPAGYLPLAVPSCWLSLIGQLDQQMSKHVLILSGRVISSVRCHVVRCPQGLFLLIPACVSLSKLITPHGLTCVFVCSGVSVWRSSWTTWQNFTRTRSSTSSRSWPAWRRRSPTSPMREPETYRSVRQANVHQHTAQW